MFDFEYLEITHNCWTNKRKELFGIVFGAQQCLLHEITVTLCGILLLLNVHTTVEPIQTRVLSIVCVYNNHISYIKYLPDYQGDNYSPKQTPLLKRRIQSYLGIYTVFMYKDDDFHIKLLFFHRRLLLLKEERHH